MPTQRQRWREQRAQGELRRAHERARLITTVRPVALTALVPGAVVWGRFPPAGTRRSALRVSGFRPAVVTGRKGRTVVVRVLTASVRLIGAVGYTPLEEWAQAGLDRRSALFGFDVEVDRTEILEVVGELGDADRRRCLLGESGAGLSAVAPHAGPGGEGDVLPAPLRKSA